MRRYRRPSSDGRPGRDSSPSTLDATASGQSEWPGGQYLELRATVPLPADEHDADDLSRLAVWAVDLILRVLLAGKLEPLREAYRRLTGVLLR